MKRYFLTGLALVLLLALSAIFYGAWLNEQGEYKIAERMEERRLALPGARAEAELKRSTNNFSRYRMLRENDATSAERYDEARLLFRNKDLQKVYGTEYAAGNMGTNQEFIARLTEITPSLSEPAAMRSVTWQIDNSAKVLEPQTYGGVSLTALKGYSVLAVPLAASTDCG